jgi:hypothetical protein
MTDSEIVNSKLLQDANIIVNNIYDLVNTKEAYPEAIHVLIGLIEEINDFNIKQGIVRALLYSPSFVLKCQQVKQNNCCC